MIKKIKNAIKKHRLLLPGQHVLVAVSGGADSVALLHALREHASSLGISLTAAHLNHEIRGKNADNDAVFVKNLAKKLKTPFVQGRSNVPRLARRKGLSLEMAAREARYAFLAETAGKVGADVIATAHTADDQAETVLLKLARGAGPRGLGGIAREINLGGRKIIRPMLDVTKNEIIGFLREKRLTWREDESNRDVSFLRNKVRHEILPLLESKLNPNIRRALLRTAEVIREEDKWLEELTATLLLKCCSGKILNVEALIGQTVPARRRVLRLWLVSSGVSAELIDFDAVDRVDVLLRGKKGSKRTCIAGNWIVRKSYGKLLIERKRMAEPVKTFREGVNVPGETVLADSGLRVITSLEPGLVKPKAARAGTFPAKASINYSAVGRRKIVVRSWRDGDRMKPLGLNGTKKLQDIFVDEKVPVEQRGRIPLFECGGEIIWLPGYRVARGWEVARPDRPALQVHVERI